MIKTITMVRLVVLVLVFANTSLAYAQTCADLFETPKRVRTSPRSKDSQGKEPKRTIDVWRFHGSKDFNQAAHFSLTDHSWKDEKKVPFRLDLSGTAYASGKYDLGVQHLIGHIRMDQGWSIPNPNYPAAKNLSEIPAERPSLHDRNQEFPLGVMQDMSYLDASTAKEIKEASKSLDPSQVTFIEIREQWNKLDLIEEFGEVPAHAKRDSRQEGIERYYSMFEGYSENENPRYDLAVGAIRLISGQPHQKPLPLALEALPLKRRIDRKEFPVVFEFGRAAQIDGQAAHVALRVATYFALQEVVVHGDRLEDAYVFADSRNPAHNRLYGRVYKMAEFTQTVGDPEHKVFYIPLKALVEHFELENFGEVLSAYAQASGKKGVELLSLRNAESLWNHPILQDPQNPERTIEVRDFSDLAQLYLEKLGGGSVRRWLPSVEFRDTVLAWAKIPPNGQYSGYVSVNHSQSDPDPRDPSRVKELRDFLEINNAVEVFVPDAKKALSPEECKQLLVGTYRNVIERLRAVGVADPEAEIKKRGVRFAFSYFNHKGSPVDGSSAHWVDHFWVRREPVTVKRKIGWAITLNEKVIDEISFDSFFYTADQVQSWSQELGPTVAPFSLSPVNQERLMSNPEFLRP